MTGQVLHDAFAVDTVSEHWQRIECGSGRLALDSGALRLVNGPTSAQRYSNAQIDDYQGLPRGRFLWSPP